VSRRKLLLADDSVTIQKVVNLTFADEGIEVFAVGDGNDAIDRLMEIAPDLVMADVNMPGLSGYQVCERIRQSERFKNIPVILLVGSFEPFDEQEAQRVGASDFLTKPFQSIRQLVSKVTELLERSPENAEMSSSAAASSFADTQEMPQPLEYQTPQYEAPRYDEAEIDDEMIQTNSPSNFAFDEAPKFASRNYVEPREEDYGKTQPLSAADLREIESAPDEPSAPVQEETSASEIAPPQTASTFDSENDDDFLELFDEDEFEDEEEEAQAVQPQAQAASPTSDGSYEAEAASEMTPTAEAETVEPTAETENTENVEPQAQAESIETAEAENIQPDETETTPPTEAESPSPDETMAANASSQLSPEMIDAIAQRVIEKLSASAVKEIAWEVVPQQADVIIKKMVEEKLKE
jgi:CheY-like chemotaxis protein